LTTDAEKPNRVQLRNVETQEVVFVRFGSDELHALRSIPHPRIAGRSLWEQVYDFAHRWT
jgi:hypothetical protein